MWPDREECIVLVLIGLIGLFSLPLPFSGDQALFMTYARDLDAGSVLYRDLWDSKQPGIFLFYWLAGRLFGFTEIGVHAFELVVLLAFSLVLMRTARTYVNHRLARLALPLLTVGLYYLSVRPKILTQVELLTSVPLYLALWLSLGQDEKPPSAWRAFAAGVCGGIVVWLKLYFLPIVVALWGVSLLRGRSLRRGMTTLAGFVVPVLALVAWGWAHGVLPEMVWTYVTYPRMMAQALAHEGERFGRTLQWFLASFSAPLLLAACGMASVARRGRRSPMFDGAWIWTLVGSALVLGQLSWWKYYTLIVVVPLGVLAAVGVDHVMAWDRPGRRRAVAVLCLAAVLPGFWIFVVDVSRLARHNLAVGPADRLAFQRESYENFGDSLPHAEFARSRVRQDETICVIGNPLVLYLSRRSNAIPINGWSPEAWTIEMWDRVLEQIELARPTYIYVGNHGAKHIAWRYQSMKAYLNGEYHRVASDKVGTWYLRNDAPDRPPMSLDSAG
jgi:hypothetical protein